MSQAPAHRDGGPAGDAGSHAAQPGAVASVEIVLVAGRAQTTRAGFAPGVPPAQTTLGSGPLAGWRIDARGVEPVHAELAWDGQRVWVRDAGSANGTYVGVERIDAWRALVAGDRFALGEAAFVVVADETTAPRIADDDPLAEGSTRVAPMKPVEALATVHDALPRAPSTGESAPGAFDAERTVITESPRTPLVGTPAPSAAIRAMGIPPPRVNRPTPGPQAVPPPRRGGYGERSDESTVAISTEGSGTPVVTSFVRDAPGSSAETLSGAPAMAPPPPADLAHDPSAAPTHSSSLPPGELTSLFGVLPPRAPPPPPVTDAAVANLRAGYAALPRRTLALFAMTLVAGVAMLVIVAHRHSVEAREAARDAPPPRSHAPAPAPAADAYHGTPPLVAPPAGPTGTLLAANPAPAAPVAPVAPVRHGAHHRATPAPVVALSPDAQAEQAAAAALASAHFADALTLYSTLATAHPEAPVYGQLVQILRRKLEALAACSSGAATCAPTR